MGISKTLNAAESVVVLALSMFKNLVRILS